MGLPQFVLPKGTVRINLRNGTFIITPAGINLQPFDRHNFITYQLPFNYDPLAEAPTFKKYLNEVLPDIQCQTVLAEFLGYIFVSPIMSSPLYLLHLKVDTTHALHAINSQGVMSPKDE
jgi:putative DNA primase/helicase